MQDLHLENNWKLGPIVFSTEHRIRNSPSPKQPLNRQERQKARVKRTQHEQREKRVRAHHDCKNWVAFLQKKLECGGYGGMLCILLLKSCGCRPISGGLETSVVRGNEADVKKPWSEVDTNSQVAYGETSVGGSLIMWSWSKSLFVCCSHKVTPLTGFSLKFFSLLFI